MNHFIATPYEYPNTPQAEVGTFWVTVDNRYAYQREHDVLFINPAGKLIACHDVGFLEDNAKYRKCSREEFTKVLNTTLFSMNILNGEFKNQKQKS